MRFLTGLPGNCQNEIFSFCKPHQHFPFPIRLISRTDKKGGSPMEVEVLYGMFYKELLAYCKAMTQGKVLG